MSSPESSAASPRRGNGGGSCTCSGYARSGEPAVFDSSRCPVHAKPRRGLGREGMVTVWDEGGRYVGCMGVELWRHLLTVEAT